MTDFGSKNYVFDVKTLSGYISAPFLSWNFIFGHNALQHLELCLLGGVVNFWLCMTDFGLKNYVFDVKKLFRP